MVPDFEEALRIASNKHDIVALKVFDKVEQSIPNIGLIKVYDSETGAEKWIDTSSRATRDAYEKWWTSHITLVKNIFKRCGVDSAEFRTDIDYVKPLINLFENR
jgi:hypothetical protein